MRPSEVSEAFSLPIVQFILPSNLVSFTLVYFWGSISCLALRPHVGPPCIPELTIRYSLGFTPEILA